MANYKVTYFAIKGLGEPIRLLLSYGGKEFEDERITFEDWPKIKNSMPMGQLPVLEMNGKKYNQSLAICKYLAKQFHLYGDNDLEALEIDIAVENINDFRLKLAGIHFYEKDPEIKEKKFAEVENDYIPSMLDKFEAAAAANNGHFAVNKLTWVDLYFTAVCDVFNVVARRNIFENRPNLQKVKDNVMALPAIKAWYAKAPKTDM